MNGSVVLDASALLAVLKAEPGAEAVEPRLDEAVISSVNWLEVLEKMLALGISHEALRRALARADVGVEVQLIR